MRDYLIIGRPISDVELKLLANGSVWLSSIAEHARIHGGQVLSDLGFTSVTKRIDVKLGRRRLTKGVTRLPIEVQIEAETGLHALFVGHFQIAPMGPHRTHVTMVAVYQPPNRLDGEIVDPALRQRVAEATVRDFMERLAAILNSVESKPHAGEG